MNTRQGAGMQAISDAAPRVRRLPSAIASRDGIAIAAWAGLILVAGAWGRLLIDRGAMLELGAPPLVGHWRFEVGPGVVAALSTASAIVGFGPPLVRSLRWRTLLTACAGAAALWAIALALTTGPGGITDPLENHREYLTVVPLIHSPGQFLSTFLQRIDGYPTHVRSHPPGMALILYGLARAGLDGSGPAAALIIAVAVSAPVAALLAARSVAGEDTARRAAPFLVLAPAAVWIATSADALYMGVGAWAVALVVLAIGSRGRRADALALAGGTLFGASCFLSFGLTLVAAIPLAVAAHARRPRPLVIAAAGALAVVLAFAAAGYWWLDGYGAARHQYLASVAMRRPYGYFLVADLGALALAAGPALAIALARLRDRRLWLLVGGAGAAVALADVSGMSKGEVERIWLPFLPWLLLAAAALPRPLASQRRVLTAQAAVALAIQVSVATIW
jgi:hypothetical protein